MMTLRLLPASLFGRLMTALLSVVVVTAVIVAVLIVRERNELAFRRSDSGGVVDLIAMTSTELARLPRDVRAAELVGIRGGALSVERGPPSRPPPPQQDAQKAAAMFKERLSRELGMEFGIEIEGPRPGPGEVIRIAPSSPFLAALRGGHRELDIGVVLPDGERVTYRTPVPFAEPPLPPGIFYQLLLLTVGLAVVLYAMTRTITNPLSALARAAETVGRGGRQAPLPEIGAREIRDATRAFNTMQERLHRYLDSRTQVLTAMSHDLRTPLTRLRLRAERIRDPAVRLRLVADLDAMNGMVMGALNAFKGLDDEEPMRSIEIGSLLEELRAEFADLEGSVTIGGVAREPITVKPQALKRCLTNLLSNAVKYGERATVTVEDQGSELLLRVLDEGPGIPEDALDRVFAPYFRLESSRNAATGGVGLGLSIARDIAQAHGGSLVLSNRAPRGLEAILRLPRSAR